MSTLSVNHNRGDMMPCAAGSACNIKDNMSGSPRFTSHTATSAMATCTGFVALTILLETARARVRAGLLAVRPRRNVGVYKATKEKGRHAQVVSPLKS